MALRKLDGEIILTPFYYTKCCGSSFDKSILPQFFPPVIPRFICSSDLLNPLF